MFLTSYRILAPSCGSHTGTICCHRQGSSSCPCYSRFNELIYLYFLVRVIVASLKRCMFPANKIRLWNKGVDSESFHPRFRNKEMRSRLTYVDSSSHHMVFCFSMPKCSYCNEKICSYRQMPNCGAYVFLFLLNQWW